jgi:hypothetical protein
MSAFTRSAGWAVVTVPMANVVRVAVPVGAAGRASVIHRRAGAVGLLAQVDFTH